MTPEEFINKWADTHTEMQLADSLRGSLIRSSEGDKGVTNHGKLPGKNVIEREAFEKKADDLRELVMDAVVGVRAADILDKEQMPYDKLLGHAIRLLPQKIEQKGEMTHSFADMVKKIAIEAQNVVTVEVPLES